MKTQAVQIQTEATRVENGMMAAAHRAQIALGKDSPDKTDLLAGLALVSGLAAGMIVTGKPHAVALGDAMRARATAGEVVTWADVHAVVALARDHLGILEAKMPSVLEMMRQQAPGAFASSPPSDAALPTALVREMFFAADAAPQKDN